MVPDADQHRSGHHAPVHHLLHSFCATRSWHRGNGVEFMEYLQGKQCFEVDAATLAARVSGYQGVLIDSGTGDGRYVQHTAQLWPEQYVIGIDACRENLYHSSHKPLPNALYVIANAEALPIELSSLATRITINFPWGSLLTGLLTSGSQVLAGLHMIAWPSAQLEIRLNSSALLQEGWSLEQGGARVQRALRECGF